MFIFTSSFTAIQIYFSMSFLALKVLLILVCIPVIANRGIHGGGFRGFHVTSFQNNCVYRSQSCICYYGPLVPTEPQLLRDVSILALALDYRNMKRQNG